MTNMETERENNMVQELQDQEDMIEVTDILKNLNLDLFTITKNLVELQTMI